MFVSLCLSMDAILQGRKRGEYVRSEGIGKNLLLQCGRDLFWAIFTVFVDVRPDYL